MSVDISSFSQDELKKLLFKTALRINDVENFLINEGTGTKSILIEYDVDNSQVRVRATLDVLVIEQDNGALIVVGDSPLSSGSDTN